MEAVDEEEDGEVGEGDRQEKKGAAVEGRQEYPLARVWGMAEGACTA